MDYANMLDRLLANLKKLGLTIEASDKPGELLLRGPNNAKTPAVLDTLRAFKPQLLARLAAARESAPQPEPTPEPDPEDESTESCRVCGLTVTTDIRPRLADPLWCPRGGARATKELPAEPRCPYKPPLRFPGTS